MPLRSIGNCPWCSATVDMKKDGCVFRCPVCECRYRHNWLAWVVGIPLAVGVAILVFQKLHIGTFAPLSGAIVAIIVVSRMGLYRLVEEEKKDVTVQAVRERKLEKKESRWTIIFMVVLLAAIAALFFFAMKGT